MLKKHYIYKYVNIKMRKENEKKSLLKNIQFHWNDNKRYCLNIVNKKNELKIKKNSSSSNK